MFIASEHQITENVLFRDKAIASDGQLPNSLHLHVSVLSVDGQSCKCIWEADSIESVVSYVEPHLMDDCVSSYFEVDPATAIG